MSKRKSSMVCTRSKRIIKDRQEERAAGIKKGKTVIVERSSVTVIVKRSSVLNSVNKNVKKAAIVKKDVEAAIVKDVEPVVKKTEVLAWQRE